MLTDEARNFNWLLSSFVEETAGVTDAVAVSSDGVLIARSNTLGRPRASSSAPSSPAAPAWRWRPTGRWTATASSG